METILISKETIRAGQLALSFGAKLMDLLEPPSIFEATYCGPNYRIEKFLWWTALEEGEKLHIKIVGKKRWCEAVVAHISGSGIWLRDGRHIEPSRVREAKTLIGTS